MIFGQSISAIYSPAPWWHPLPEEMSEILHQSPAQTIESGMLINMGSLNNIFGLVVGINLVLVGAVACTAGIVSLAKRDGSVKILRSVAYLVAGTVAVYVGVGLLRSFFNI